MDAVEEKMTRIGLAQEDSTPLRVFRSRPPHHQEPRNDAKPLPAAHDDKKKQLSWIDNPGVQKLLDIVASIIADEYIQIAKQNPEVFKNGGEK